MKAAILFLIPVLALCSCGAPETENKHERIAKTYCECTQKLVELNNRAMEVASDTTQLPDLQAIQNEYANAQGCATTIISKYGKLNREDQQMVMDYVSEHCPALAHQPDLLRELLGQ